MLIAGGVGSFQPRKLSIDGAAAFERRGLEYGVKDPAIYAGKKVLIVGGGDSGVDWANTLAPIAAHVTLIHRRDQFRAHEQSVEQLRQGPTTLKTFRELAGIEGDGNVERAIIYDNRSNERETLDVDAVLVNIGFVSSLGPIGSWGLELEGSQIRVDSMMRTNLPRVFAAGDICAYAGKLKLIATGFGEACIAVNYAKHDLDPRASIFPGHSSNRDG